LYHRYEGKLFVEPSKDKSSGQFGGKSSSPFRPSHPQCTPTDQFHITATTEKSDAQSSADAEKNARGEKTAENIRYGEAISEHGFGGETVGNSGGVEDGNSETQDGKQTRKEQGYGDGSGVGA
jgi:hypothetical protein